MNSMVSMLTGIVLVLCLSATSSSAQGLDPDLDILEPLTGKTWVGAYIGDDAPDLEIVLRFEIILDGKAVRYTREAKAAEFTGLTHIYWNAAEEKVCFLGLNNRGLGGEGTVFVEEGKIIFQGSSFYSDKAPDFKTILELDEDGILSDKFFRLEKGEWVQGHLQEFRVAE